MAECQKVLLRLKQDESKIFVEDNFTDTIWASLNFLQFSCDAGQATMAEFCPPGSHQKCHTKRFQHVIVNWLAFTSNTCQFYCRPIPYIRFSLNGFKIWNFYLNPFQQHIFFSTDKNNELLLCETKSQYTFPIYSLNLSRKSLDLCSALSPYVFLLVWGYIALKFHQIMPWNLCWPLNCCKSETSKTDKLVE